MASFEIVSKPSNSLIGTSIQSKKFLNKFKSGAQSLFFHLMIEQAAVTLIVIASLLVDTLGSLYQVSGYLQINSLEVNSLFVLFSFSIIIILL